MILSGIKFEEYREIKPYWTKRLEGKKFGFIKFTNGYGDKRPAFYIKYNGYKKTRGLPEWGAEPGKIYYVICFGRILRTENITEVK